MDNVGSTSVQARGQASGSAAEQELTLQSLTDSNGEKTGRDGPSSGSSLSRIKRTNKSGTTSSKPGREKTKGKTNKDGGCENEHAFSPTAAASASGNSVGPLFATAADVSKLDRRLETVMGSLEKLSQIVPVVAQLKQAFDSVQDDEPDSDNHGHGVSLEHDVRSDSENEADLGLSQGKPKRIDDAPLTASDRSAELLDCLEGKVKKKNNVSASISPRLADLVQSVLKTGIEDKDLDKLMDTYARPENCPAVNVPKINQEIWDNVPADYRTQDVKVQKNLKPVVASMNPILILLDQALTAHQQGETLDPKQVFDCLSDSVNMLASGIHLSNVSRKDSMKPVIQHKFRRLCSGDKPVGDEFLFGEELAKEVKELDESSKVINKITSSNDRRSGKSPKSAGTPYHPYARGDFPFGSHFSQSRMRGSSIFSRKPSRRGGFLGYNPWNQNRNQGWGSRGEKPKSSHHNSSSREGKHSTKK